MIPPAFSQANKVKDIWPGNGHSAPIELQIAEDGTLFFHADNGSQGYEPWKSDGTAIGTSLIKDVNPGPASSVEEGQVANGQYFFWANDGMHGIEPWSTNGTASGTKMIKDVRPGPSHSRISSLIALNNEVLFGAFDDEGSGIGFKLYKTDGSAGGTTPVYNRFTPRNQAKIGDLIYYRAYNSFSQGYELWTSDGTTSGTQLIKDICPGTCHGDPTNFTNVDGVIFFNAKLTNTPGTKELYKTDGTNAGTMLVKDINVGPAGSEPSNLTNVNGTLFFFANDGTSGRELWKSDGTSAGTVMVKNIQPGASNNCLCRGTEFNGLFYFSANDGNNGYELWKSDGTLQGTEMVKDIRNGTLGSNPNNFFEYNGYLYFSANDGIAGDELWRTDGTPEGTELFQDIYTGPNSSWPQQFIADENRLFFTAIDDQGRELWLFKGDLDNDGYTVADGDCDDNNDMIYPNQIDICDGIDNNCNGAIDEGFDLASDDLPDSWNWSTSDIGFTPLSNGYSFGPCTSPNPEGSNFIITGSGNNATSNTTDNIAFFHQTICGDGSITTKIESVDATGYGGLMIRETTAPGSKQVAVFSNMTNILRYETRTITNMPKTVQPLFRPNPIWLKMERQGMWVHVSYSNNGMTFQPVQSTMINLSNCVEIGLASFTFLPNIQTDAVFSNVSIVGDNGTNISEIPPGSIEIQHSEQSKLAPVLFPNPTTNTVNLVFENTIDNEMTVRLHNQLGQVLQERLLQPEDVNTEWDVSTLNNGVYFMELRRENHQPEVLRFLKVR